MVFGAMTQANGFETGWNINNLRWTGDYWISQESYISDIDINLDGSNIFYASSISRNHPTANICVLSLGSKYQISSNIGMPMRVPFSNVNSTYTGRSHPYTVSPAFIIPTVITPGVGAFMAGHGISGVTATTSSSYYFITPDITADPKSNVLTMNVKGGATVTATPRVLNNNPYNIGGMYGITVKRDTSVLLTLSGLDITKGSWLLSSLTFNSKLPVNQSLLSSNISNSRNFTNIYTLFPNNMKPTNGNGIVVDREKGQYLFVNALINSKWTICKFQLRAT